jgi:hypothetical protein
MKTGKGKFFLYIYVSISMYSYCLRLDIGGILSIYTRLRISAFFSLFVIFPSFMTIVVDPDCLHAMGIDYSIGAQGILSFYLQRSTVSVINFQQSNQHQLSKLSVTYGSHSPSICRDQLYL